MHTLSQNLNSRIKVGRQPSSISSSFIYFRLSTSILWAHILKAEIAFIAQYHSIEAGFTLSEWLGGLNIFFVNSCWMEESRSTWIVSGPVRCRCWRTLSSWSTLSASWWQNSERPAARPATAAARSEEPRWLWTNRTIRMRTAVDSTAVSLQLAPPLIAAALHSTDSAKPSGKKRTTQSLIDCPSSTLWMRCPPTPNMGILFFTSIINNGYAPCNITSPRLTRRIRFTAAIARANKNPSH